MTGEFETALRQIESEIGAAEKKAKRAIQRLARARRGAANGDIVKMLSELDAAPKDLEAAIPAARELAGRFGFDLAAFMQNGDYAEELRQEAEQQGLVLVSRDGRLSAFPSLLKLEPRSQAVRVGRKLTRAVRPSVLVGHLRKAQQASNPNPAGVLEQIWRVYRPLAQAWKPETEAQGPVIALLRIHELQTVLPAAAKDYPRDAFACDLLHLNRAPDIRTRDGHGFSLHASTSARGPDRINVYDELGAEHIFVGIRFHATAELKGGADGDPG